MSKMNMTENMLNALVTLINSDRGRATIDGRTARALYVRGYVRHGGLWNQPNFMQVTREGRAAFRRFAS